VPSALAMSATVTMNSGSAGRVLGRIAGHHIAGQHSRCSAAAASCPPSHLILNPLHPLGAASEGRPVSHCDQAAWRKSCCVPFLGLAAAPPRVPRPSRQALKRDKTNLSRLLDVWVYG
jgi:hypothetical protein